MPASSSAGIFRFLEETSPGVIESGGPQIYRVVSGTLAQTTEASEDNELRADRGKGDSTLVSGAVAGPLDIAWSHKTHDAFLETLLAGTYVEVDTDGEATVADMSFDAVTHTVIGTGMPIIAPGQWFQISGANTAVNDGLYKSSSATHTATLITVDTAVKDVTTDASASSTVISSSRLSQSNETLRTWTIERELADITPAQFFTWAGCYVNSLSLSYTIGEKLTGSFGFIGTETEEQDTASGFAGIGSEVAATTTPFFNSVTGTSVLLDGVSMGESCMESLSVEINGNLRERRCLGGGLSASSVGSDPFSISFSASVYFGTTASADLYAKKISDIPLTLSVCLTDSNGAGFAITMPRCKVTEATVDGGSMGSDVIMSLAGMAVTDPTDDTIIHVDRLGSVA